LPQWMMWICLQTGDLILRNNTFEGHFDRFESTWIVGHLGSAAWCSRYLRYFAFFSVITVSMPFM
jgi:hypothetical protein